MATVKSNVNKTVTMTNSIEVDGVQAYSQSVTIDTNNLDADPQISDWITNPKLYRENRTEIRNQRDAFEDSAYEEQAKLASEEATK